MKDLVFAVISICLQSGECETHQMKVEPRVCHLKSVQAQVPMIESAQLLRTQPMFLTAPSTIHGII